VSALNVLCSLDQSEYPLTALRPLASESGGLQRSASPRVQQFVSSRSSGPSRSTGWTVRINVLSAVRRCRPCNEVLTGVSAPRTSPMETARRFVAVVQLPSYYE